MTISISSGSVSPAERNALFAQYVTPRLTAIRRQVEIMSGSGEDPDDNLQEVLIHLLEHIHLYDPERAAITTWLSRVVAHKMTHIHAYHNVRNPFWADSPVFADETADFRDGDDTPAATPPALIVSPEYPSLIPLADDYPTCYPALMSLSALQRRILLLTAEGWSVREIADELRLTPAVVSGFLYRARTTFRKYLRSGDRPAARPICSL